MKGKIVFMLLLVVAAIAPSAQAQISGSMHLSYLAGEVQIEQHDSAWAAGLINMPVVPGDRIWVSSGGRAEIMMGNGTVVRLNELTDLEISQADETYSKLYIDTGDIYINLKGGQTGVMDVVTPGALLRSYGESLFRIRVPEGDQGIEADVFRGALYLEEANSSREIREGFHLAFADGRLDVFRLNNLDEFVRWNNSRDYIYASQGVSAQYLPEQLRSYSGDLDNNGRWVYESEYGYVWTPTAVAVGWAPFRMGRWCWMGGDYVWISYDRWGWVPHHYGRWAFIKSRWCWVPPARGAWYWGPGYVGWVLTSSYIGWVPLAPGELYYGRGFYGPNTVNVTKISVANIQANRIVCRNSSIRNAATIVKPGSFATGKHINVSVKGNPFHVEKTSVGSPARFGRTAQVLNVNGKPAPERRTMRRTLPHASMPAFQKNEKKISVRAGSNQKQPNRPAQALSPQMTSKPEMDRRVPAAATKNPEGGSRASFYPRPQKDSRPERTLKTADKQSAPKLIQATRTDNKSVPAGIEARTAKSTSSKPGRPQQLQQPRTAQSRPAQKEIRLKRAEPYRNEARINGSSGHENRSPAGHNKGQRISPNRPEEKVNHPIPAKNPTPGRPFGIRS